MLYLDGLFELQLELRPHMRYATHMVDVERLVIKAQLHVVAVGCKIRRFLPLKDVIKNLASVRDFLIWPPLLGG